jgi:hypothetical protein
MGSWSGPDGTVHPIAFQNLLNGSFWFFPALALGASSSSVGSVVTYVGHEIHNGLAVEHVTVVTFSSIFLWKFVSVRTLRSMEHKYLFTCSSSSITALP